MRGVWQRAYCCLCNRTRVLIPKLKWADALKDTTGELSTVKVDGSASWSTLQAPGGTRTPRKRYGHTVAVWDGIIYLYGGKDAIDVGLNGGEVLDDVWAFDPSAGLWAILFEHKEWPNNSARVWHAMAALGGKLYVNGGESSSDSNNFRAYNIIAGTWTTLDVGYPLVGYRKQHKMAGWGNKIYMFGGAALYEDPPATDTLFVYDITTNEWSKLNAGFGAPVARTAHGMVAMAGLLIVFGGTDNNLWGNYPPGGDNYFNDLVAYDIAGASWRSLGAVESGDKPSPRYQFGMALSGNSVYVMSGGNASGDLLDDLYRATFSFTGCGTECDLSPPSTGGTGGETEFGDDDGGDTESPPESTPEPDAPKSPSSSQLKFSVIFLDGNEFNNVYRDSFKSIIADVGQVQSSDVVILEEVATTEGGIATLEVKTLVVTGSQTAGEIAARLNAGLRSELSQRIWPWGAVQEIEGLEPYLSDLEGSNSDSSDSSDGGGSSSTGMIAGVVVGLVAVVGLGAGVFMYVRKQGAQAASAGDLYQELPTVGAHPRRPRPKTNPINPPGAWNFFLSHHQAGAKWEAAKLFNSLGGDGSAWLDVEMRSQSADAMMEGVDQSAVFLIIMTPQYLDREFCIMELKRAVRAGKTIVLTHTPETKTQLSAIFQKAGTLDLGVDLSKINSEELILRDRAFLPITIRKILAVAGYP